MSAAPPAIRSHDALRGKNPAGLHDCVTIHVGRQGQHRKNAWFLQIAYYKRPY
jgi:hypothetical protein